MTLKRRERVLLVLAAVLAAVLLGLWLFSMPGGSLGELRRLRDDKRQKLAAKQAQVARAATAAQRLAAWEKRALPRRPDVARSSYQNWLRELVERLKFRDADVFSGEGQNRQGVYAMFPFRVQGKATIEQVVHFLHEFYSKGHLHLIRRLRLARIEGKNELDVLITIEALSLSEADREDQLSPLPGTRLARSGLAEYLKVIGRRLMEGDRYAETGGVFAAYSPPPPPPRRDPLPKPRETTPSSPPPFDHAKYTLITGVTAVNGRPEAWIEVKTTGERFVLSEGESFQVGTSVGRIVKIDWSAVTIEWDGRRRIVPQGASLHDGEEDTAEDK